MAIHLSREERAAIIEGMLAGARSNFGSAWVKVNCEFCPYLVGKTDTTRSFAFNRSSSGYTCFRCGVKGYLEGAPEHLQGATAPTDAQMAALRKPPPGYVPLWTGMWAKSPMVEPAVAHLEKRGIPRQLWEEAQIGYGLSEPWEQTPEGKWTRNLAYGRIIVPVLGDGGWLGWSGRAVWPDCPKKDKYRTARNMERYHVLYNHAALLVETNDPVYVVEGVFDALFLWPDGVAVFGGVTEQHLWALAAAKRPVVFIPDGDAWEAGLAQMLRLRLEGQRAGCIRLPPKKDPDELDPAAFWELGREALISDGEVRY